MKIVELHLDGFGRFHQLALSFPADLTLVLGPNEAGKTTVLDAVAGILFGFRRSHKRLRERYRPWQAPEIFRASLVLQSDGGARYLIGRDFHHDRMEAFRGQGVRLEPLAEDEWRRIQRDDLGLGDPRLFESTALVRQPEMNMPGRARSLPASLAEILGRKLAGGDGGNTAAEALRLIRHRLAQLHSADADASRMSEVATREQESARLDGAMRRLDALRAERDRLRAETYPGEEPASVYGTDIAPGAGVTAEPGILHRAEELASLIASLEVERRYTEEALRQYQTEIDLLAREIAATNAKLEGLDPFLFRPELQERLAYLMPIVNENAGRLGDLFPELDRLTEKLRRFMGMRFFAYALDLLAGAAAIAAWGFLSRRRTLIAIGLAAVLWLCTIVLVCRSYRFRAKRKRLHGEIVDREAELTARKAEIEELLQGKTYIQFQAELEAHRLYHNDLWGFEQALARKKAEPPPEMTPGLASRLAGAEEDLSALLFRTGCRDLAELRARNAGRAISEAGEDGNLRPVARTPEATRDRLAEVEEEIQRCEESFPAYDRAAVEAELNTLRACSAKVALAEKGLNLAAAHLESAIAEVQVDLSPGLSEEVSAILAEITGGRYREIQIELAPADLVLRVRAPGAGALFDAVSLSAGVADQLYLALRVGLLRQLTAGERWPLILDDPFASLDRGRLAATAGFLAHLAAERQVIWLTKDPDLADLVATVANREQLAVKELPV